MVDKLQSNRFVQIAGGTHSVSGLDLTQYSEIYVEARWATNEIICCSVVISPTTLPSNGSEKQFVVGKADHSVSIRISKTSAQVYEWINNGNDTASSCKLTVYGKK